MGVPSHDVSDIEMEAALIAASDGHRTKLMELLTGTDDERVSIVINKLDLATELFTQMQAEDENRLEILRVVLSGLDEIAGTYSLFQTARDKVVAWAGRQFGELSVSVTGREVLATLERAPDLRTQLVVFRRLHKLDPVPEWLGFIRESLSQKCADELIEHLKKRDNPGGLESPGYLIYFLSTFGLAEPSTKAIKMGLESGTFTIADVAARFVRHSNLSTPGADNPRLDEFGQDEFDRLVPACEDEWYDKPVEAVESSDLSWENRRRYAAGRAKRPGQRDNDGV